MVNRPLLSQAQKEQTYWGKLGDRSLSELATAMGCTVHCARKWVRVGRDKGLDVQMSPPLDKVWYD